MKMVSQFGVAGEDVNPKTPPPIVTFDGTFLGEGLWIKPISLHLQCMMKSEYYWRFCPLYCMNSFYIDIKGASGKLF